MKPTITKITIGRLHNLGNSEHIRYEVTVEIPKGNHAGAVIQNVTKLLGDLEPKQPVAEYYLSHAREALSKPVETLEKWDVENKPYYERIVAEFEAGKAARKAAHEALGNLSVETTYTDAKDKCDE
jgi:hypothetical protein